MSDREPCKVNGCDRRVRNSGLCFGHYRRGEAADVAPRAPTLARNEAGHKRCRACEQWLPVGEFTKDFRAKDGRRSLCLRCHSDRRRMARFGVSAEWFDRTFASQGHACAICQSLKPRGRGWAIDHDHQCCPGKGTSCGKCVRGILCSPCNLALGLMGDSPDALRTAAAYLTERMSIVRGV